MAQTRRDVLTAGAAATLAMLAPATMAGAAMSTSEEQVPTLGHVYRQAFETFEAAVRPSSEVYWNSHNRAVADIYARDEVRRRSQPAQIY